MRELTLRQMEVVRAVMIAGSILGAAKLLAASGEDWARDLIEDSLLDEATKAELLAR